MHPNPAVAFFMSRIFDPALSGLYALTNLVGGDRTEPAATNAARLRRVASNLMEALYHLILCLPPTSWLEYHSWAPRGFQLEEARLSFRHAYEYAKEIRL